MISLVSTVYNDREGTKQFFYRMSAQTRPPDEIVIVDSFSKDGTWDVFQTELARTDRPWRLTVWQERCNVARGRNLAIAGSSHSIIASTDIGCDWDPEWLEELTAALVKYPGVGVVVGSWAAPEDWAKSIWAKTEHAYWPSMKLEAKPESFSSSRSIAYRKSVWQQLGGYPEDLTLAADDSCFDALLKKHKVPAAAAPLIRCYWHRHETLQGFLKEQYRYFFGNGEAAFNNRHFLLVSGRLGVEVLSVIALLTSFVYSPWRLVLVLMAVVGLTSIVLRMRRFLRPARTLSAKGVNMAFLRLVAYDYLTKLWGLVGYVRGYVHGCIHCREVRYRLSANPGSITS